MLMSGDVPHGSLCSTDDVSQLIEELQFTLGEGPCIDAFRTDRVVSEPNLANPDVPRWIAFTPRVLEAGARAVFGFPLREGSQLIGALNLYNDRPGSLTDDQHQDALATAEVLTHWVIQTQAAAPEGTVASQLEAGSDFHFVVHNAAGIVSVQLEISVAEAMTRLRAAAFAENRPVREVAEDVVAHRRPIE
jgi:GAF domain-containing protein